MVRERPRVSITDMLEQFDNAPETNVTTAPGFNKADFNKWMKSFMAVNKEDTGPLFVQELEGVRFFFKDEACTKLCAIVGPRSWNAIEVVTRLEESLKADRILSDRFNAMMMPIPKLKQEDFVKLEPTRGPQNNEPFYRSLPRFKRRNR